MGTAGCLHCTYSRKVKPGSPALHNDTAMITARLDTVLACAQVELTFADSRSFRRALFANSLNHPVLLAEGASVVLLHPQRHAAVVERVVAFAPHDWKK